MEEFIPTFEEKQENNLLVQIDEFEEQIKLIDKLSKKYDSLKKKIKTQMLNIGKEKDLSQVKWITPKGIQITCSIGKRPTFEEQEYQEFDMGTFKKENPSMYEKYLITRTRQVAITNGSNDRLTITLPKGDENE
jgi:hypothetical protein